MKFLLEELDFYYINLDRDPEKSRNIENKLGSMGIDKNKIYRIRGHENQESYIGILHSQIDAIKKGLEGKTPFVVLEDDIEIGNYVQSFDIPDSSQCTYLGISGWGLDENSESLAKLGKIENFRLDETPSVCRIQNMFSAHAILYYDWNYTSDLLENLERVAEGNSFKVADREYFLRYYGKNILPCDIVMAVMQNHHFVTALKIPLFYQGGEHEYCTRFELN
jgi:regulator of RNase E activity RraB